MLTTISKKTKWQKQQHVTEPWFLTSDLQLNTRRKSMRRTVAIELTAPAPSTLWGMAGLWSSILLLTPGEASSMWLKMQKHNITNLYYSFISFPQMTFSVYPQCHHWAHQQGVVHGGWWHSSSDRRETLHPQNEPAGWWRPSQSYHDPTDGAEADHERSETIWNYFVALR